MHVAQLDRASDYGSEGRVFESCRAQSELPKVLPMGVLFSFFLDKNIAEVLDKETAAKYNNLCLMRV